MAVALGWVVLGIAIAIASWRMDRLAQMNIEPWSAPGIVPGLLGVLIALFGVALALRERRAGTTPAGGAPQSAGSSTDPTVAVASAPMDPRIVPVLVLCAVFVLGLLGRGLPFTATSAALVFAWIVLLRFPEWRAAGSVPRGVAVAAVIALVACFAIAHLFQDVFLVRLP
jgi:hypothetical protein